MIDSEIVVGTGLRITVSKDELAAKLGVVARGVSTRTTVLVLGGPAPPPQTAPHAKLDPDHEMLIEVERTRQTGGPEALEPAALLAREIGQQAAANRASQPNKETNHED